MLTIAREVGWPKAFQNDLYLHDRSILDTHPGESFLWILREHGTHLFPLNAESPGQATYARTVIRYWSGEDRLNIIPDKAERPKFFFVSAQGSLTETDFRTAQTLVRYTETVEGTRGARFAGGQQSPKV